MSDTPIYDELVAGVDATPCHPVIVQNEIRVGIEELAEAVRAIDFGSGEQYEVLAT